MRETIVLLDRREAARRLRVSLATVKRYGASGLLEERRIGPRLIRITEASVDSLVCANKDKAA
ncbi:MAG: helix-turn-helix domain-containing protein [Trebonia sp.]